MRFEPGVEEEEIEIIICDDDKPEEDEVIENVVRMVNEKFASETKKSPPEKKSPPSYRDAKNSLRDQTFTKNRFFLQARSYRKGKS